MAREGAGEHEFLIYLYSNKLAYLQLITVLVYGNSSTKSHEQSSKNLEKYVWMSSFLEPVTKNELFLRYFSRIFFKSFRGFLLPRNSHAFTEHLFYPCIFVVMVNTQQTFQRCFNVIFWLIWCSDVVQPQINVETTLRISTLEFTTWSNVESTFCI